jgi:hypothetical protein
MKTSVRIVGVTDKSRTGHLRNTNRKRNSLSGLAVFLPRRSGFRDVSFESSNYIIS